MKKYEEVNIVILPLNDADVITTSGPDSGFNSDGDNDWSW